jgi:hypothetical protein
VELIGYATIGALSLIHALAIIVPPVCRKDRPRSALPSIVIAFVFAQRTLGDRMMPDRRTRDGDDETCLLGGRRENHRQLEPPGSVARGDSGLTAGQCGPDEIPFRHRDTIQSLTDRSSSAGDLWRENA